MWPLLLAMVADFGSNPGALDMYEYVPANLPTGRPLVVVLHGCGQSAAGMEPAGWNALADKYQFAVLYPQQRSANQQLSCFNWYNAPDIARTGGEAESIIEMVDKEIANHGVDRSHVYVTGMSAGGAFAAVMMAAYPDRFRAGSIMSGLPYKCATDLNGASTCTSGTQKAPDEWGALVHSAYSYNGAYPRVQIWHGSKDYTVNTVNATELVKQWTNVWGIEQAPSMMDTISTATHSQYKAGSTVAVELYLIDGMGHAIATGSDPVGTCPATSGAFFADEKICSTLRAWEFFEQPAGSGSDGSGSGSSGGGDDDGGSGTDSGGFGCSAGGSAGVLVALAAMALRRRRR
jgi:poly(hydroxyalkanoate) depolymerase family esterase